MIDPSKIIILSMFCNKQGYIDEKNAVKKTWGYDAIKAGFKHIFYTETLTNNESKLDGNILYVNSGSERLQTYDKTILAFKYIEENFDYDIIVKTNVSTYVNIEILKQLLEYKNSNDQNSIYGNRLLCWPNKFMGLRGDFTIINRNLCKDIISNYAETKTIFKDGGQDDSIMFYLLYGKYGLSFCKKLKTIVSNCCSSYDYNSIKNACAIRLKTSQRDLFKDICKRIFDFHKAIHTEKNKFYFKPLFNKAKVKIKNQDGSDTKISYKKALQLIINKKEKVQRAPYGRIAIYTCITGDYDVIQTIKTKEQIFDFICFTDKPNKTIKDAGWKILPIPSELNGLSNVKKQRLIKICPHRYLKDYNVSLWVDANIAINGSLFSFIEKYDLSKFSVYTCKHPLRDCIYDEEKACIKLNKDVVENTHKQIEVFKNDGFPEHSGLAETGIILRKHTDPSCINLMETWAKILIDGSHRDQLSFDYSCWKTNVRYGYLKENFRSGKGTFFVLKHKSSIKNKKQNVKKKNNARQHKKEIHIFPC